MVPLGLVQCSSGLSGVRSRNSRLCSYLMGNRKLLWMQCRGIGTHLSARGKSHEFSQVAAGSWVIISSSAGNGTSKLVFPQRRQDSCLVGRDTSAFSSKHGRAIETPLEVRQETQGPFPVATGILEFLSIFMRSQASSPFEALILCASRVVKGM